MPIVTPSALSQIASPPLNFGVPLNVYPSIRISVGDTFTSLFFSLKLGVVVLNFIFLRTVISKLSLFH